MAEGLWFGSRPPATHTTFVAKLGRESRTFAHDFRDRNSLENSALAILSQILGVPRNRTDHGNAPAPAIAAFAKFNILSSRSWESRLFEDLSFSIPVDRIECRVVDGFQLSDPVEEMRTATWEATRKKRPSAFDGTLLRLAGHHVEDNRLVLRGNRTTFSAYVATRSPEFSDDYSDAQRADPLGMTAMVSTRDNQLLVTKRSLSADQNPGALYFIGGYAEPPEQGVGTRSVSPDTLRPNGT